MSTSFPLFLQSESSSPLYGEEIWSWLYVEKNYIAWCVGGNHALRLSHKYISFDSYRAFLAGICFFWTNNHYKKFGFRRRLQTSLKNQKRHHMWTFNGVQKLLATFFKTSLYNVKFSNITYENTIAALLKCRK